MSANNLNALREQFDSEGFIGPFDLLTPKEAKEISAEAWKTTAQEKWAVQFRAHEQIPALKSLVLSPGILTMISNILGPEVVFWGGRFMAHIGQPDPEAPRWHQELDFPRVLGHGTSSIGLQTYLALDEATAETGTMQVLPGSHKNPLFDVNKIYEEDSLFNPDVVGHAYSIITLRDIVKTNNCQAVDLNARPGQFYLFDWKIVHQRGINGEAGIQRLTINSRYTTPHSTFNSPMYTDRFPTPLKCVEGGNVLTL